MLPRSQRIPKTLFNKVSFSRVAGNSALFSLKTITIKDSKSRFSCIVSKKIDNRATKRNELRRHCYLIIEKLLPLIPKSLAVIIYTKKGAEKLSTKELESALFELFKTTRLISS